MWAVWTNWESWSLQWEGVPCSSQFLLFLKSSCWNFFRRFPTVTAAELRKHNDVCSICLGEMARARKTWSVVHMLLTSPLPNKLIVIFRCGHIFHPTCLAKALDVVNACPVCKQDIPTWPMKTWKIYVLFYKKLSWFFVHVICSKVIQCQVLPNQVNWSNDIEQ